MSLTEMFRRTAAPGEESAPTPQGMKDGYTEPTHESGVHRGFSVVLPKDKHDFVHDPNQPAPAKALMLLSEMKKQVRKNQGPEGEDGSVGGLGNYWTPVLHKAHEYATQSSSDAYRIHERKHNCGDEEYGENGCTPTHVIVHADTPDAKDHWHEQFRPGEEYHPELSWRLPVRPGSSVSVRGVSWQEGDAQKPYEERSGWEERNQKPYTRYDFAHPVQKEASA